MSSFANTALLVYHWIGTLMCLSAVIVFSTKFENPKVVVFCIIAFALSAASSYLVTISHLKKLESWYTLSSIRTIRDFGMCLSIILLGIFSYVIFDISYYGWSKAIHAPISESKIILAVWCFISAKYAFTIFWLGRSYYSNLSETRLILQE